MRSKTFVVIELNTKISTLYRFAVFQKSPAKFFTGENLAELGHDLEEINLHLTTQS